MNLKDKLKSAVESAKIIAKNIADGKELYVTEEEFRTRMSVCQDCPSRIKATDQCGECSCFLIIKGKLSGMKCPLGKW